MKNKQWVVFHVNNVRVASIEKTNHNLKQMKILNKYVSLNLIQEDIGGTLHYNVTGRIKSFNKCIKELQSNERK